MADRFIDQDEVTIYGPYASNKIRKKLLGLIPEYDSALNYAADQIDVHTDAVKSAVEAARGTDAWRRQGARSKAPLLKQARALLGKFSTHLGAHDNGAVDRRVFFTKDGTAGAVGKAAADVVLAVAHITTKLAAPGCAVRDAAHWHGRFDAMTKSLAPVVAFADDARIDRQSLTPEVETARQVWLNGYVAARALCESLLRHLGRVDKLRLYFYDLQVNAGTKVTEPPAEEPEAREAEDTDEVAGDE
ncbi:hypothetical protein [Polyangium mundeleinium]|uniref:Uncharacterized protein n=1 Tax=Polyangium mundeleinium TaxID=2995306 RepID=A0ABT5F740_9BACT|nr:hypothetical protein [Polyangium mundeleinium]MDC0749910.1 hypothetical protein [Polyangium mundeleinium]